MSGFDLGLSEPIVDVPSADVINLATWSDNDGISWA